MIKLRFNDELISIVKQYSLAELLAEKGYTALTYAVAVNRRFIPRAQHATTLLCEDDLIETIAPMQGG